MEKKELTGKFYDIQGFSVHDGPGIRLTPVSYTHLINAVVHCQY